MLASPVLRGGLERTTPARRRVVLLHHEWRCAGSVDMLAPSGSLPCLESAAKRIMFAEISIYSSVQKWLN